MLVQAWPQKEKRPEYQAAPWQPEPELAQPPPRSVSFGADFKLVGALILLVVGIMLWFVCMPSLKHAYLTSYGVSTKGTIQQRDSRRTSKGGMVFSLVVRYETPSGLQSVHIQTSQSFYARTFPNESVPLHYLARAPSQVALDDDQLYQPWQILLALGLGATMLWFPYYVYRRTRTIAESGLAVKGLITKIDQRLRNCYLTVYYEIQDVPYQGTTTVRANQAKAEWQVGNVLTILASDPPSRPGRPHVVMAYPASEFKINL